MSRDRQADPAGPILPGADAPPHHPDRHVHRQRQIVRLAQTLAQAQRSVLARKPRRRGSPPERDRLRSLHPPSPGPHGLEHTPRRWPMDAHLPQRSLRVLAAGVRPHRRRRGRQLRGERRPGDGGGSGRLGRHGLRPRRRGLARTDSRAYAGSRGDPPGLQGRGRSDVR